MILRSSGYLSASSLLIVAVLVGAAGDAAAQPPGAPPRHEPPPGPPAAVVQQAAPAFWRWSIGVHLGGLGVVSARDQDAEKETEMGLVGVQLRYRLHRRWELELDVSAMGGELPGPGDTRRASGAVILGGMFHINPDSPWLCSVLFGVGAVRDVIWYEKADGDFETQAEFVEGLGRIGFGVERRFDRLGVAAQLYGIGMARDEEELDGPDYIGRDGPVPEESSGALFQLVASYYF
jgi:hypothetical protein